MSVVVWLWERIVFIISQNTFRCSSFGSPLVSYAPTVPIIFYWTTRFYFSTSFLYTHFSFDHTPFPCRGQFSVSFGKDFLFTPVVCRQDRAIYPAGRYDFFFTSCKKPDITAIQDIIVPDIDTFYAKSHKTLIFYKNISFSVRIYAVKTIAELITRRC